MLDSPAQNEDNDKLESVFQSFADALKANDVAEAEAAMCAVMETVAKNADKEPDPWLQCMQEAHRCEAAYEWADAEEAYKNSIRVTEDKPGLQFKSYDQLAAFYSLLGREAEAEQSTRLATAAARRADMAVLVPMALRVEAAACFQAKDYAAAWDLLTQIFEAIGQDALHDILRTQALIMRADYHIAQKAFSIAAEDLSAAWKLIEPWQQSTFAGGWQGCLAKWWAVKAHLRSMHGDKPGAIDALREVVARKRIISQLPQLEGPYKHNALAVSLRDLGRLLREVADPLALYSLQESSSIRRSIGLPPLDV